MIHLRAGRLALAAVLMLSTGACALLPHRHHWVKMTPVPPAPAQQQAAADEAYYQDATRAITNREYGRALELLQAARARKADDVRVINAFAVVYDKLGRFDLSARYYAQAEALDPGSPILAQNLAYSALLQARSVAPFTPALAQAAPVTVAPTTAVALAAPPAAVTLAASLAAPVLTPAPVRQQFASSSPGVLTIGPTSGLSLARTSTPSVIVLAARAPGITGRPLAVINASGRPGAAEPVRTELARLGWSAPRSYAGEAPVQPKTTIVYPQSSLLAARALARTLPIEVQLVACKDGCEGLRLIVGADVIRRPI
jgi:hypothetical protein